VQDALRVAGRTLRDWYYSMLGLAIVSLVWAVCAVTVVLLAPATAGLYAVTNSAAHGTGSQLSEFVEGTRRYLWVSVRWLLLNVVVGVILAVNVVFYAGLPNTLSRVIFPTVVAASLLWLMVQFYTWPFLLEQEVPRLRTALRNGLFLTLGAPFYSLTLLVIVLIAIALSVATVLPLAIFISSFIALLGNHAVVERLARYGKLRSRQPPLPPGHEPL